MLEQYFLPDEGWTEFAVRAGIDPKSLLMLKTGATRKPTRGTIALLAAACGIDADEIRAALTRKPD